MGKIARVFPRRTAATPDDDLAFVGLPGLLTFPEVDEVHVSVAFTYDRAAAEEIAFQLQPLGVPVKVGGPAYNEPGGEFIPGMYLKQGYTITSRGCPNRCWFCSVPQREGYQLRELPIKDGWNILDDNLLACSYSHIYFVFQMLKRQAKRPIFTGGLEAAQLCKKPWVVDLLREVKVKRMYFAYDTPDDLEPLMEAGMLLRNGGIPTRGDVVKCYVLIGYPGDTFVAAETRLRQAWSAGFWPYAMLYRNEAGTVDAEWKKFYQNWSRPEIVGAQLKRN